MKRYKNVSGNSTVTGYEIVKDAVTVRFATCAVYKYNVQSAGPENIRQMRELALAGKGLGTFIEANLKERFSRKVR
ncbi:MAG: hypothetical protein WC943_02465 [Elusimicrobiota bacterium]|jgi:hypothetical protein